MIIRKDRFAVLLLIIFIFLSVFQIPVYELGNDSIGLYDLFIVVYFFIAALISNGFRQQYSTVWALYFIVFLSYILYLAAHLLTFYNFRSILIIFKYVEFGIAMYLVYVNRFVFGISIEYISKIFKRVMFLLAVFQLVNWADFYFNVMPGIESGFGYGHWYRVGLPFKRGTSSNPAGFVLATYLFYYIYNQIDVKKNLWDKWLFPGLLGTALLLTVSRTNFLAFAAGFALSMVPRVIKKFKYKIIVSTLIIIFMLTVNILFSTLDEGAEIMRLLYILQDPRMILQDQSFSIRYQILWTEQIHSWLSNIFTMFWGLGLNYFGIADTTYTGLLANQGLIGFCLFMFIWYIFFIINRKNNFFCILLVVALINGLNAETLVISYRSVQVYIFVLFLAFHDPHFGQIRRKEVVIE